jgi:hypothetical protein
MDNKLSTRVQITLQDIADKIQIDRDLSITYLEDYSICLSEELKPRFAQLPENIRQEYLQVKLQNLIQEIYYKNSIANIELGKVETEAEKLENQPIKWSKSEFYRDLCLNNHSSGYFDSGWSIVGQTPEGLLQVKKNDLMLHISTQEHLAPAEQSAKVGDMVAVKMPPQLVEAGYYIAIGNAGSIAATEDSIVDIYFNINADGALALMDGITDLLNQIELAFQFKVLYHPDNYIWYDAASLSFASREYLRVKPILDRLREENQAYFSPLIPLFTKYLAPGLSLAERPLLENNFRQHRCKLIALGLIDAWQAEIEVSEDKINCTIDRFKQAGIDLARPYLNPGSKDIY